MEHGYALVVEGPQGYIFSTENYFGEMVILFILKDINGKQFTYFYEILF